MSRRVTSAALFYALIGLILIAPGHNPTDWGGVAYRICVFSTLLLALRTVSDSPAQWRLGLFFTIVAAICNVVVVATGNPTLVPLSLTCIMLFSVQLAVVKIRRTLLSPRVTRDMIYSAMTAYMVAGLAWCTAYLLTEKLHPGSFLGAIHHDKYFATVSPADMIYFSVSTMTTAGYGDILPVSPMARNLACLQMLFGTMYPSVILARLVGLHSTEHRSQAPHCERPAS